MGGIDRCFYAGTALGKECQDSIVDIVVDQDNGTAGGTDQIGSEFVGIEQLAVIKDTFYRRQGGTDEKSIFSLCSFTPFSSLSIRWFIV